MRSSEENKRIIDKTYVRDSDKIGLALSFKNKIEIKNK